MKTLTYGQLKVEQQQQVNNLIADLQGQLPEEKTTVRFVARGAAQPGEF